MQQIAFAFDPQPIPVPYTGLTCAFGSPWGAHGCGPCEKCHAETARGCAEFAAAVARGEFDSEGYTPNERKAQQKKRTPQ